MKKITLLSLEGIRRLLAFLVLLLWVMSVTVDLFGRALQTTALNKDSYTIVLQSTQLVSRVRYLAADILMSSISHSTTTSPFFKTIPATDWDMAFDYFLPQTWVVQVINSFYTSSLGWIMDSSRPLPDVMVDLHPVKEAIQSPNGILGILQLMQNAPTCINARNSITLWGEDIITCLPPANNLTVYSRMFAAGIANGMVHQETISRLLNFNAQTVFSKVRTGLVAYQWALQTLDHLSLFLLCLFALLNSISLRRLLSSLKWPFYAAGGFSLLLLGARVLLVMVDRNYVLGLFPAELQAETQSLLLDIIVAITGIISQYWLPWAIGLLILGMVIHGLDIVVEQTARRSKGQMHATTERPLRIRRQFR